jgi:hypothetical protein
LQYFRIAWSSGGKIKFHQLVLRTCNPLLVRLGPKGPMYETFSYLCCVPTARKNKRTFIFYRPFAPNGASFD